MAKGSNKCAACGEWSGAGHKCPTRNATAAPERPDVPAARTPRSNINLDERLARAQSAMNAAGYGITATVNKAGEVEWRNANGELHREDGPAVEFSMGGYEQRQWYRNGVRHREDGPAIEYRDPRGGHGEEWYLNGELHREDGPAVFDSDENRVEWFRHGQRHREDGPAFKDSNGIEWYRNGVLHREDGPAVVFGDGTEKWYKDGVEVSPPDPLERAIAARESVERSRAFVQAMDDVYDSADEPVQDGLANAMNSEIAYIDKIRHEEGDEFADARGTFSSLQDSWEQMPESTQARIVGSNDAKVREQVTKAIKQLSENSGHVPLEIMLDRWNTPKDRRI